MNDIAHMTVRSMDISVHRPVERFNPKDEGNMEFAAKTLLDDEERQRILFLDFPPLEEITAEVRERNKTRIFTGGVRINAAMYRTAEEDRQYRAAGLKRKLP